MTLHEDMDRRITEVEARLDNVSFQRSEIALNCGNDWEEQILEILKSGIPDTEKMEALVFLFTGQRQNA